MMTYSLIAGILVSPIAGQAEDNPVTRLQQRSAAKRFQQMKSQHQEWESTSKQEHVPQATDDWAANPNRNQRRTERQQSRTQRSDDGQPVFTQPAANAPVNPTVATNAAVKPNAPAVTPQPAPPKELTPETKQQELIPATIPNLVAETKVINSTDDQWTAVTPPKKLAANKLQTKPAPKPLMIYPLQENAAELFEYPVPMYAEEQLSDLPKISPIPVTTDTVFPLFEPFKPTEPETIVPLIEEEESNEEITALFPDVPVLKSVSLTTITQPKAEPELNSGLRNYTPNKISDISPFTDYQPADSIDPNNIEGSKLCEISLPDQACPPKLLMEPLGSIERNSPYSIKYWYASCITYNPLYFEDVTLERYGQEHHPLVQPFISVGKFGGQLVGLPYQMAMHPVFEEVSPLGYYRPGEPSPEFLYQVPLNGEAALTTGAFYTGMFFLVP